VRSSLVAIAVAAAVAAACRDDRARAPSSEAGLRPPEFTTCHLVTRGLAEALEADCATITVPEDRGAPDGPGRRMIALHVAVVRAAGRDRAPDPVMFLAGGPGEAATEAYPILSGSFLAVNSARDVVLVDQRGTGGSHPLDCPELQGLDDADAPPPAARDGGAGGARDGGAADAPSGDVERRAAACRAHLDGDLTRYTTDDAVSDLEDVRAALGYPRVNLYGASYGTRVAIAYARRAPDRVRSVVLDGVAPPGWTLARTAGADLQRSLSLVFDRCAANAECKRAFPDLPKDLADLAARLESPREVTVPHPTSAVATRVVMSRARLASTLRGLAAAHESASLLPLLVHAAAATGDLGPLAAQALLLAETTKIAAGMHLSVACAEDAPFLDAAPAGVPPLDDATPAAFYRAVCRGWPSRPLAEGSRAPFVSSVPALLLSGEIDPLTPPANAEAAAKTFPRGLAITVPGEGHVVLPRGCLRRVMTDFVAAGSADRLDAACAREERAMGFFTSFAGPAP